MASGRRAGQALAGGLALTIALAAQAQTVEPACAELQASAFPASFAGCAALERTIEDPGRFRDAQGFRLGEYERALAEFFAKYCHRNAAAGWVRDKRLRDTGPWVTSLRRDGTWRAGRNDGTHLPVVIWYNARMLDWLARNRPAGGGAGAGEPVPDGALLVKEMYEAPAARCSRFAPERLKPSSSSGLVFMVRDARGAHDGWFWGAWWDGFEPDWPADGAGLPAMGYGAYCLNCHASARDHATFADLKNVQGFPGEPNSYLSQNFAFEDALETAPLELHRAILEHSDDQQRPPGAAGSSYPAAFLARYPRGAAPSEADVEAFPSQTYDHVWMPGAGPSARSQFVTSDQCLGCHDAGSTGLQFDMSAPPLPGHGDDLQNLSPYATWRSSPMGLGGRDPVFFAQLASETQTFHPQHASEIEDVCLGCHGVQGQRQLASDRLEAQGACGEMRRADVAALPVPPDPLAPYGALARDGIACSACHHMALGEEQIGPVRGAPQNRCVEQRQARLNPELAGFARTFTGSFFVGPPDELLGPFREPRTKPMQHALGVRPVASADVRSSELCGSCHTVHLPVYGPDGALLGRVYEQTTYAEWAFSAFRTGALPGGQRLPAGPGREPRSCQDCHMPSRSAAGRPLASKIASIQELQSFPATENTLPAEDIDLPVRPNFAQHTLVGLNVFLVRMARQFPNLFGIPTSDPMLYPSMDPLEQTEQAMLAQASAATATVEARPRLRVGRGGRRTLVAQVTVRSAVGHKFPSGVGFRRAFLEVSALDAQGRVLWASGRTDANGLIVDEQGRPVAGEQLWTEDCSARLAGTPHQPHYETIRRQDQVQIYQELVTAPAPVPHPTCGSGATPGGPLTTSFLSICRELKDNRILPRGYLGARQRAAIARALGADAELAAQSGPVGVGRDPDYRDGGGDSLVYEIELDAQAPLPAALQATLYDQATPPFYLQDRFCTARGADVDRLYFLAGHLDAPAPTAQTWKLAVATSGAVPLAD